MSVIVDASVLVSALVDVDRNGNWAEEILASGSLHAPELVRVETANILRRLEIARQITRAEANAAWEDLMRLALELYPFEPFAERAWALRHSVTCYDGWYVAIAERLNLPLATLDRRLTRARGARCRFLVP